MTFCSAGRTTGDDRDGATDAGKKGTSDDICENECGLSYITLCSSLQEKQNPDVIPPGLLNTTLISFPLFPMGQYFKAVNLDKREVVCPWCLGGGAKLWEWAANRQGVIFTLLLRKSDEAGGGDFYGYRRGNGEGGPIRPPLSRIAGRWAVDRIALVGDYDSSKLWDELGSFRNISGQLVEEWNSFIELPELKLTYRPECSCN